MHRHPGGPGAVRWRGRTRSIAGLVAAILQPFRTGRAYVHRHPDTRHLPPGSRDGVVDVPLPHARDHHRAVARPRPVREAIPRFPSVPEPLPLARFSASDDLRAAIGLWANWLAGERRASAHTIAAYGRDLAFFLDFLSGHLGGLPSLATISALQPADFRAYLARRAQTRIERRSLARGMSVLRGFVRFLERRELVSTSALAAMRSPKLPESVPKPLSVVDAIGAVDAVGGLATRSWQGTRDTAILALLYGCGLRL